MQNRAAFIRAMASSARASVPSCWPRCTRPVQGKPEAYARKLRAHLPKLETERLHLRPPTLDDFPAWAEIFEEDIHGHIGGPMGVSDAWSGFCGYVANWLLHGFGMFAVVNKTDGVLLGFVQIGLEADDYEPELGWLFRKEVRGKGYGTEAASAVRAFGSDLLGEGDFVSYIDERNLASQRIAEKLGAIRDLEAEKEAEANNDPIQVWRHGTKNQ